MSETTTLPGDHVVTFYEQEPQLIEHVGGHLLATARAGASLILIATPSHRRSIEAHLRGGGVDLAAGRYRALDAHDTLAAITADGGIDAERFASVVGDVVMSTAARGPVVMFGEMVDVLWQAGDVTGALELEERWNDLLARVPATLLCGYRIDGRGGPDRTPLGQVCQLHSEVIMAASPPEPDRHAFEPSPETAGAARRFVAEALARMGCGALADDARLVISELATNAVLHARTSFSVVVEAVPGGVRLSVEDTSTLAATKRHGPPLAVSGRGLDVVAAIATRWGEESTSHGKIVWAELT